MESSRRDLFIDIVDRFIFKKSRSPPVSSLYSKWVWGYLEQGLVFTVRTKRNL